MAGCHTGATVVTIPNPQKRVGVIGQPNTGKSTFFNRITKAGAAVANWPGITVDLLQATVNLNQQPVELVDLPGIYDLNGFSDDERGVQRFLETYPVDLILVVVNASQIDRQIRMPLQVKALGLPVVLVLNMSDEARRYGIQIDAPALSQRLEMPVFSISAKYGNGCPQATAGLAAALKVHDQTYQILDLKSHLDQNPVTEAQMQAVLAGAVQMPPLTMLTLTNRLDKALMHPLFGLPLFFAGMFGIFWFIWTVGIPSADPVDAVTGWIQESILTPLFAPLPTIVKDFLINGIWNGFASVASFVPLIALFFTIMALLEDSGYLSRAAYLMDAFMSRLGLDGRAFVLQMMGFGCNVPAIMGTRVIRSRAMRLLSMLTISFSLCSARLQVFIFILAAVLPGVHGAVALFSLYLLSFASAFLTAAALSRSKTFRSTEPFVLELPPYRLPTLKQVWLRVWGEMQGFVRRTTRFIILGTIAIWFLTNFPLGATGVDTLAGQLGGAFSPIMQPIGINPLLTVSLIFGFIAKEVQIGALAVLYGLSDNALGEKIGQTITAAQGYSYCIFSLLYVPCLTTISVMLAESKSSKFTGFAVGFSLIVAWVASLLFYQTARLLGFE